MGDHSYANVSDVMIRRIKIGQKMKLPMCGKLVVNHKEKRYAREADYYFDKQLDPCIQRSLVKEVTQAMEIINTMQAMDN